jgi:Ca2+-binding RTX toxin-like protein
VNGPTTLAEFRAAIMTAPAGDTIGEGRFLAQLGALSHLPAHSPDRQVPPDANQLLVDRASIDHAILATALVTAQDLVAAPAPALDLGLLGSLTDATAAVTAPTAENAADLVGDGTGRDARLHLDGVVVPASIAGTPHSPFAHLDSSVPYMLVGDLQSGLVIDTQTKTVLQGGPGDYPQLGAGPNDTLELDGDYSGGFGIAAPDYVEQVVTHAGNDYNLIASDSDVAAGRTLTINAAPLGDANHIIFDGSAETDGRFVFLGSDADDMFIGGAGDDKIYGLGGADILAGGGGSDTFAYYDAAHSSGPGYDVLADFDPAADKIDLEVNVTGFDTAIQSGTLSTGNFNADLGAALAGLGAGHAMLYTPDAGDLAGNLFLIVDANGIAGYQEGEDYVFALPGTTLADLNGHTDFFI